MSTGGVEPKKEHPETPLKGRGWIRRWIGKTMRPAGRVVAVNQASAPGETLVVEFGGGGPLQG